MREKSIVGQKVALRPWKSSDAKAMKLLANDRTIARFTSVPFPYRVKHARDFIRRARKGFRDETELCYAITLKETGEAAGSASLIGIVKRHGKAEIGYWLGKSFRRKGLARESVQLLLRLAFNKMKLNRVVIKCNVSNERSRKIIEGTGARFEGIEREGAINGLGKKHDTRVYSILAREFRESLK